MCGSLRVSGKLHRCSDLEAKTPVPGRCPQTTEEDGLEASTEPQPAVGGSQSREGAAGPAGEPSTVCAHPCGPGLRLRWGSAYGVADKVGSPQAASGP